MMDGFDICYLILFNLFAAIFENKKTIFRCKKMCLEYLSFFYIFEQRPRRRRYSVNIPQKYIRVNIPEYSRTHCRMIGVSRLSCVRCTASFTFRSFIKCHQSSASYHCFVTIHVSWAQFFGSIRSVMCLISSCPTISSLQC